MTRKDDFRKFLFRATGDQTDPRALSITDVYDNCADELERLHAVVELLQSANIEEADVAVLPRVGLILRDIHARMRAILELGQVAPRSGSRSRK